MCGLTRNDVGEGGGGDRRMSAAGRGREAGLYYYFYFILFPFLSFGGVWFTHFTHFTYIREGRIRILRCIYLFSHSTFARSSIRLATVIKIKNF